MIMGYIINVVPNDVCQGWLPFYCLGPDVIWHQENAFDQWDGRISVLTIFNQSENH